MRAVWGSREEAPWSTVPRGAWWACAVALAANLAWQAQVSAPTAVTNAGLSPPAPEAALRALALGEPELLARVLLLGLFGGPAGRQGAAAGWMQLDYEHLAGWLERLLALDPSGQGPLLAAARLFGEVPDPCRQRRMIRFIREHFAGDPARRWPWMAHAVFLAQHRLDDLPLALDVARELAEAGAREPAAVPAWARQMHLFVLEDMGEVESVKVLIGGLLASGRLTDPNERRFLEWRLRQMEADAAGQGTPVPGKPVPGPSAPDALPPTN